jgi:hypothetical protein
LIYILRNSFRGVGIRCTVFSGLQLINGIGMLKILKPAIRRQQKSTGANYVDENDTAVQKKTIR